MTYTWNVECVDPMQSTGKHPNNPRESRERCYTHKIGTGYSEEDHWRMRKCFRIKYRKIFKF